MIIFEPMYPKIAIEQLNRDKGTGRYTIVTLKDGSTLVVGHYSKKDDIATRPSWIRYDKIIMCYPVTYRERYNDHRVVYEWGWKDDRIKTEWHYFLVDGKVATALIAVFPEYLEYMYSPMAAERLRIKGYEL